MAYFGASWPGCGGFYPDGSAHFETFLQPLDPKGASDVLQKALGNSSGYRAALRLTGGSQVRIT